MDIQLRQATSEDLRAITRIDGISFGVNYTEQDLADIAGRSPRFVVAADGDLLVGVAGDFRFELTVPGGRQLPVPGLTWVSVLPTHRRRGVLSTLMRELSDGYTAAGEPCAVLTASEGGIYRRFGYGASTRSVKLSIDRRLTSLRNPVDSSAVEFLPAAAARTRLPELPRQWQQVTPGALSRDEAWWTWLFLDREVFRNGMTELVYLAHPGGYLGYRAASNWADGLPDNKCVIVDYKISTEQAHAALWQVLLAMDLFSTIESWEIPADDPLPLLLTDQRQVRTVASKDGMWLRPVELSGLLAARRYQVEVEAVLDVDGERLALAGGPDGAECVPTDRPAEAWLDRSGLGSIYLGGVRVNTLARAGLLRTERASLQHRLDLAFGSERVPAYGTSF